MWKTPEAHALSWPDGERLVLTELEYQIIERLRWGRMNSRDIARDLGLAPKTIHNYLHERIYTALGVHSRLHAVMTLMATKIT